MSFPFTSPVLVQIASALAAGTLLHFAVGLASGTLAYSGGPVYDPSGKLISRFSSVWRLEAPGKWRIIFDRGAPVCDCQK